MPLNLIGASIIAVAPAAAVDLVACMSPLLAMFNLLKIYMWGRSPTLIINYLQKV
jgi:hypothetical protein